MGRDDANKDPERGTRDSVKRRGLLAGLAALGAVALAKLTAASAQATHSAAAGDAPALHVDQTNQALGTTVLNRASMSGSPAIRIISGGPGGEVQGTPLGLFGIGGQSFPSAVNVTMTAAGLTGISREGAGSFGVSQKWAGVIGASDQGPGVGGATNVPFDELRRRLTSVPPGGIVGVARGAGNAGGTVVGFEGASGLVVDVDPADALALDVKKGKIRLPGGKITVPMLTKVFQIRNAIIGLDSILSVGPISKTRAQVESIETGPGEATVTLNMPLEAPTVFTWSGFEPNTPSTSVVPEPGGGGRR